MQRSTQKIEVFDQQASAAVSDNILIGSFRNQVFGVFVEGDNPSVTIKARVSMDKANEVTGVVPDLQNTADKDNIWSYVDLAVANNAGGITDGDTGLVIAAAGAYQFELNQNGYEYAAIEIISPTDAVVTCRALLSNNS